MKYHIDFDNDGRLTFNILDNPAAQAWANILKEKLQGDNLVQKVYRDSFPVLNWAQGYFNNLQEYYNSLNSLNVVENLFELKEDFESYTDEDFRLLDLNVDKLFLKIVHHNFYYNQSDEVQFKLRRFSKRIKRFKEQLLDSVYDTRENYVRIHVESDVHSEMQIPWDMRKAQWVESPRSKVVIRLCPNFEVRSLNTAELRNNPTYFKDGSNDAQHFITVDHKIHIYDEVINQDQANKFMTERRNAMIGFANQNKIDVVPGDPQHYYFMMPVVAELISEDLSPADLHALACNDTQKKVSITIED